MTCQTTRLIVDCCKSIAEHLYQTKHKLHQWVFEDGKAHKNSEKTCKLDIENPNSHSKMLVKVGIQNYYIKIIIYFCKYKSSSDQSSDR